MMKCLLCCFSLSLFIFASPLHAQKSRAEISVKKEADTEPLFGKLNLGGLKFRSVGPAITSGRIADIDVELKNLEQQLGAAGAPYSPGNRHE